MGGGSESELRGEVALGHSGCWAEALLEGVLSRGGLEVAVVGVAVEEVFQRYHVLELLIAGLVDLGDDLAALEGTPGCIPLKDASLGEEGLVDSAGEITSGTHWEVKCGEVPHSLEESQEFCQCGDGDRGLGVEGAQLGWGDLQLESWITTGSVEQVELVDIFFVSVELVAYSGLPPFELGGSSEVPFAELVQAVGCVLKVREGFRCFGTESGSVVGLEPGQAVCFVNFQQFLELGWQVGGTVHFGYGEELSLSEVGQAVEACVGGQARLLVGRSLVAVVVDATGEEDAVKVGFGILIFLNCHEVVAIGTSVPVPIEVGGEVLLEPLRSLPLVPLSLSPSKLGGEVPLEPLLPLSSPPTVSGGREDLLPCDCSRDCSSQVTGFLGLIVLLIRVAVQAWMAALASWLLVASGCSSMDPAWLPAVVLVTRPARDLLARLLVASVGMESTYPFSR